MGLLNLLKVLLVSILSLVFPDWVDGVKGLLVGSKYLDQKWASTSVTMLILFQTFSL